MGPCFEGGSQWGYSGFIRIQNQGPILGDHGIYFGSISLSLSLSRFVSVYQNMHRGACVFVSVTICLYKRITVCSCTYKYEYIYVYVHVYCTYIDV